MLKKFLLTALIFFAAASTALAFSRDVKIVNDTGKNITHIYLSTIALEDWQEIPELAGEILRAEESIDIYVDPQNFRPNPIVRYFDLRADFEGGGSEVWLGLDLFNLAEVTLKRGDHSVTYEN